MHICMPGFAALFTFSDAMHVPFDKKKHHDYQLLNDQHNI